MRAVAGAAVFGVVVVAACGGQPESPRAERPRIERKAGARQGAGAPNPRADSAAATGIEVHRVNSGTQGMRTTVRWLLSPDRRALVVVEVAVSVEAEALPDGFLFASEATGAVIQTDSVWDVAPSPDWTRLAVGRAYVLRGGERDEIPPEEWRRVEAKLPEDVGEQTLEQLHAYLKARTFPVSGMSLMLGLGLTQVLWVDRPAAGHEGSKAGPTHSLHGWRVRWTRNGDTLGIGAEPRLVQDDAPPARWVLVRPRLWAVHRDSLGGTTDSSRFARVPWIEGPTMELGSPVGLASPRPIAIDGGSVDAHDDSIRVTTRGRDGRTEVRVVGPGVPLVATAGGRFIAALVPRAPAKPHEMGAQTVVYDVRPR